MAQKNHNVSNAELVELKKIRQGLESPPDHTETKPAKLKGGAAVANFFRYNGIFIAVGVLLIGFFAYFIITIFTNKKPDCIVVVNNGSNSLQFVTEKYTEIFESWIPDTNKDGKIKIETVDCSYDPNNANTQLANSAAVQFQAQLSLEYARLYILNAATLEDLENKTNGKFLLDEPGLTEYNGKAVRLNGTRLEEIYKSVYGSGFTEDVYMGIRRLDGSAGKSKRAKAAEEAARVIIRKIAQEAQTSSDIASQ